MFETFGLLQTFFETSKNTSPINQLMILTGRERCYGCSFAARIILWLQAITRRYNKRLSIYIFEKQSLFRPS